MEGCVACWPEIKSLIGLECKLVSLVWWLQQVDWATEGMQVAEVRLVLGPQFVGCLASICLGGGVVIDVDC